MKDLLTKRFAYYKDLADRTFVQLSDEQLFWQPNAESNSIAIIVKHIAGNMISRWTNFLSEDGEKPWRHRDSEFENNFKTREEMLDYWEKGWKVLFDALEEMNDEVLQREITIREEKHTVLDAVLRQLAHYPYHIGQIVFIAKMLKNDDWKTLTIPRNQSEEYNAEMIKKLSSEETQQNSSPVCFAGSGEVREEYKR